MTRTDSIPVSLPTEHVVTPADSSATVTVPASPPPVQVSTTPSFTRPEPAVERVITRPASPLTIPGDSAVSSSSAGYDSIAGISGVSRPDSTAGIKSFGVVLEAPEAPVMPEHISSNTGMSIILSGLFLLFCIIGLRFRNNSKYIAALMRNIVEIRLRSNVFDETVRESSFIVLLNILWSCSAGIVLCAILAYTVPADPAASFGLPVLSARPALATALCMGVMVLYTCAMAVGYLTVGTVFSDKIHAKMWLKGFTAGQGLLGVVFFPIALLLLFYPSWREALLLTALGFFIIAKIVFIWKGFRIFFTQFSSWVLFLYYLCSLEIVPLILTYWAACQLCSLL